MNELTITQTDAVAGETAQTTTAAIVPIDKDNFELSASCPEEMVQCHGAAITWCKRKIELVTNEVQELKDAFDHAVARKWKSSTLGRHWKLACERLAYYQKMLAAFEAGYYIVPNFPVTLFAIRTAKESPKRMWARLRYSAQQNFQQAAQVLPVGEGEYQNPQPVVVREDWHKDDKGVETYAFRATDWAKMEFPANMARIHVMESATKAMDAKIFDEVGFLPQDYKRNPDPLLIGRIAKPGQSFYGRESISFLIAWHINTSKL